jgi:hypothetical protein
MTKDGGHPLPHSAFCCHRLRFRLCRLATPFSNPVVKHLKGVQDDIELEGCSGGVLCRHVRLDEIWMRLLKS